MLAWDPVNRYGQHWLTLHGVEVVLVSEGPPGSWTVHVNRQRYMEARVTAGKSPTLAHAKKMAERWARVNLARLEVEVADRLARRRR
ncbi:hypothetical protein [Pseudoxanthomonas japonensis]|uniref:hypothetical protein n=1 Tax=Pseudoxanthomonas japonensis TaxID=69284 RepID=UPI00374A346B